MSPGTRVLPMTAAVVGWLLAGAAGALAAADPFEPLKAKAEEAEASKLVEAYAGGCKGTDPVEARECAERSKAAQARFKGKTLYLNLGAGYETMMAALEGDSGQPAVLLTPVFDVGAGGALTFTRPQKLGKDGTIIVGRIPLQGTVVDDTLTVGDVRRLIKTGQLGLEVVGTIKGSWELKKKDGEPVRGVEFKPMAIRFFHPRSGKALISHVER